MVNLSQDIHPLTEFKRNTSNFMSQMKKTRRPVVLTVNGKAELVVQDAKSYQQILDRLERFEAVEAIRAGIRSGEEGRVKPARQALADLQEKLAFHVDITDTALVDAEEYVQFVRVVKKEPEAAERWFRGLVHAIYSLGDLPERCPVIPEGEEFAFEIHHLLYFSHRIVFR